jgi:hypothetical protein
VTHLTDMRYRYTNNGDCDIQLGTMWNGKFTSMIRLSPGHWVEAGFTNLWGQSMGDGPCELSMKPAGPGNMIRFGGPEEVVLVNDRRIVAVARNDSQTETRKLRVGNIPIEFSPGQSVLIDVEPDIAFTTVPPDQPPAPSGR